MSNRKKPKKKKDLKTRKKNIKKQKNLIIVFFLIIAAIVFFQYKTLDVHITYNKEPELDKPFEININIKKYEKYTAVDKVHLTINHKYKKDEKINTDLQPYASGRYNFVYYPQYQGTYIGTITVENNNEKIVKDIEFNVK